jgi:hypothetical protein
MSNTAGAGTGAGQGGGLWLALGPNSAALSAVTFIGNAAATLNAGSPGRGGAIYLGSGSLNINQSTFVSNAAQLVASGGPGEGGAIYVSDGSLTVAASRIVRNLAASGSGIFRTAGSVNANDNWWGCSYGPGNGGAGCTGLPNGISAGVTVTRWLQLRLGTNPASIPISGTTLLTADLLGRNVGGPFTAANLLKLAPFPVPPGTVFTNPVLGTLQAAGTQFVGGVVTATFKAGPLSGAGHVVAVADAQSVTAPITITPQVYVYLPVVQRP